MSTSDPSVDFFVAFHDLNPNGQKQCIYFVKQNRPDRRCRWNCSDNKRAIELHSKITESNSGEVAIDDIVEYIRSNCCARARHRDLVSSSPLLILLVERWLHEILEQKHLEEASGCSAQSFSLTTPRRTSRANSLASSSSNKSASSTTSRATTVETPFSSPSYSHPSRPKASIISSIPLQLDASPTPLLRVSSTITPSTTARELEPSKAQTRYNLRPRADNEAFTQWSRQARLSSLAEFHPHINDPTSEDTVAWRLCENLNKRDYKRDFKTGSLYIYSRKSSPGYVKIGWTSISVDVRLSQWSECGYTPIELFRVTGVPYAQRVETLTHHELIKEWRREQPCKGCWMKKQKQVRHQEWFEVSPERAIEVLSTWAELFKKANPYERSGLLKFEWRNVVDAMKGDSEAVTSKRLLEHYKAAVAQDAALAKKAVMAKEAAIPTEAVKTGIVGKPPKPSFSPSSHGKHLFARCKVKQEEEMPPVPPTKESICPPINLATLEEAKTSSTQSEL